MGMAASQARYLALTARKSNCEYEGQQINQARTALSNQSANLFNQMLGLKVPVPPSTQDFTTTQYSYKDGNNTSVISNWKQLSSADPDYNYVVTHHYYYDRYTGSQKKLTDPQVQFCSGKSATAGDIQTALVNITKTKKAYDEAIAAREAEEAKAATLSSYAEKITGISEKTYDEKTYQYTFKDSSSVTYKFLDVGESSIRTKEGDEIQKILQDLFDNKALDKAYIEKLGFKFDENNKIQWPTEGKVNGVYYDSEHNYLAFKEDINALMNGGTGLTYYGYSHVEDVYNTFVNSLGSASDDGSLRNKEFLAQQAYEQAQDAYDALCHPTYIGNSELTPLEVLNKEDTPDQWAEIQQIIADMREQGINTGFENCFDADGNYIGGIYSFKLNGVTYYTTYDDLEASYASGTGINNIDGQIKLAYYNASYISTKVEETERALIETDESGRFKSIRFEDSTVTYTLNMEQVTDEAAYKDAMNQYTYENAQYDKTVQDINAKTKIIQQEDQQLELRLKQLDTEQNALKTEIDAVKGIIKDNVEATFKTFSG